MSATTRSTPAARQDRAGTAFLDAPREQARRRRRRAIARRRPAGRPQELGPWLPGRAAVRGGWVRPVPLVGRSEVVTAQRGVHLSMRGRRVLAGTFAVVLLWLAGAGLAGLLSAVGGAFPSGVGQPEPGASLVVQAGDTLWAVAERTAPGQDRRRVVAELQALNDLPDGQLRSGQLLVLPAG